VRSLRGGQAGSALAREHDTPSDSSVRLARAIRALREERGLKQIEVASAAGTSEAHVSRVEHATTRAGWELVIRLLDGMGVTVHDLADAYARAERGELEGG
jgi:transcriptional regulator with XRE-family HTH domain